MLRQLASNRLWQPTSKTNLRMAQSRLTTSIQHWQPSKHAKTSVSAAEAENLQSLCSLIPAVGPQYLSGARGDRANYGVRPPGQGIAEREQTATLQQITHKGDHIRGVRGSSHDAAPRQVIAAGTRSIGPRAGAVRSYFCGVSAEPVRHEQHWHLGSNCRPRRSAQTRMLLVRRATYAVFAGIIA